MTYLLTFLVGAVFALLLNRARWRIFPLSGGAPLFDFMGGPLGLNQPLAIHTPCPACKSFHTAGQKFTGACPGPGGSFEEFPCPKCGASPEARRGMPAA